jgi:hypothetical protein
MLDTDSRTDEVLETAPAAPGTTPSTARPQSETRAWLQEQIDGRIGVAVGIAWIVLMQIAFALEPRTDHDVPIVGIVLEVTMYALLATMVTGLVMQRRFGLVASLGAAVLATAAAIACPITGHHSFGSWWFAQMACVLALVAVSIAALHRSNTAPVPSESN